MKNNLGALTSAFLAQNYKKVIFETVGPEIYEAHEQAILDIADMIRTEKDYEKLTKFALELYTAGFTKAVHANKAEFEKYGIKVHVTQELPKVASPIFSKKS